MAQAASPSTAKDTGYRPEYLIPVPAIYAWPPRPLAALRYLVYDLLFPWGYFLLALAWGSYQFLSPPLADMATFSPGWIAQIWIRNAILLSVVAGGLHWWFYIFKGQGKQYKFDQRWQAVGDDKFLFGNQVRDNMVWCLVSGVTIWSAWESVTWWIIANGNMLANPLVQNPWWFVVSVYLVFFWGTVHFYFVHRLLHVKPIYDVAHELHHRNVNCGPWTGISMHPIEHLLYFSTFVVFWFVPVHPVIILLVGLFQGISPAISHSGFDYLAIGKDHQDTRCKISTGDLFHQLHHRYFHINYGNTSSPLDKPAGSWHDNTEQGRSLLKSRMRRLR